MQQWHSGWSFNSRFLLNLNLNSLERDAIKVGVRVEALKPNSDTKIINLLQLLLRDIANRRDLCPPTLRKRRRQHTNIEDSLCEADRADETSSDCPGAAFSFVAGGVDLDETLEGVGACLDEGLVDAVVEVVCEGAAGLGVEVEASGLFGLVRVVGEREVLVGVGDCLPRLEAVVKLGVGDEVGGNDFGCCGCCLG